MSQGGAGTKQRIVLQNNFVLLPMFPPWAWGEFLTVNGIKFCPGGDILRPWIRRNIDVREAFALYDLLLAYCISHPGMLLGTQIRVAVGNRYVALAFNKGRSRNTRIRELLLYVSITSTRRFSVTLRLQWGPTQENAHADRMTRLEVEESVRLLPEVSRRVWHCFGPFQYD